MSYRPSARRSPPSGPAGQDPQVNGEEEGRAAVTVRAGKSRDYFFDSRVFLDGWAEDGG
jgi:hypothetical protein